MRRLGGEVQLVPRGENAKAIASKAAAEAGALYIEDGAHPEIAADAGTIAMELGTQCGKFDAILVQIGDGALVTGIGSWIKATSPSTRVIGVTAAGAPGMRASIKARRPVGIAPNTVADGMSIHTPVASAVGEVSAVVNQILEVDDDEILDAMALLLGGASLVAEPSGAAGVAAIMRNAHLFRGMNVAAIVTGANVRPELLAEAARRNRGSDAPEWRRETCRQKQNGRH
jgi:threonine dehydratase